MLREQGTQNAATTASDMPINDTTHHYFRIDS